MPSASATGADAKPNGDAKSRDHNQGNQDKKYTVEQKAAVIRVRRCSPTAFYDILGLESVKTTVSESEIKKAYRKLSLLTHPDKNGHEHADEAFKMVSRAFGVLSDPEKKAKYDRYGGDPDSRFGGGGGGGASQSPFSRSGGGGMGPMGGDGGWGDDEISPEEMFARFFGGGMGGGFGPFGTFGFDQGSMFENERMPGFSSPFDQGGGFQQQAFYDQEPPAQQVDPASRGPPAPQSRPTRASTLPNHVNIADQGRPLNQGNPFGFSGSFVQVSVSSSGGVFSEGRSFGMGQGFNEGGFFSGGSLDPFSQARPPIQRSHTDQTFGLQRSTPFGRGGLFNHGSPFGHQDDFFANARRQHDEMLRRFFH
jgi:curved DNA-binding protein CbpA